MNPISKQARDAAEHFCGHYPKEAIDALAAKIQSAIDSHDLAQWHPLSERPTGRLVSPTPDHRFATILLAVPERYGTIITGYYLGGLMDEFRAHGANFDCCATHWRELPQPPKEITFERKDAK